MGSLDYAFFEAMTGPLAAANTIQQNRDAQKIQQAQIQEQQLQIQQNEQARQDAVQNQINLASQAATNEIFVNQSFRRQKDADDYSAWFENFSGYRDVEAILQQYGSVSQAMQDPKLKQALDVYKQRVTTPSEDPTQGNPVLFRAMKNKLALEQYKKYALDKDGYAKFLTSGSHQRFQDWKEGKTDNFIYTGARRDYLEEMTKARTKAERIDIDEVLAENAIAIATDMANDLGRPASSFSTQDMRNWLTRELQYDAANQRFAGEAIYGEKEIETNYATELVQGLEATNSMGLRTGNDIFNLMENGVSFKQAFDKNLSINWDRLGGYDQNSATRSTMKSAVSKGLQVMASGRVLGNDRNLETAITNSWAGTYDDGKTPRYNSQNRTVYGIQMEGLYDRRGRKITEGDINSFLPEFLTVAQEAETDDLRFTGYHVALEGKNADGDSILLTNVSSKEDFAKIKEQYGNVVFDAVLVAELIDDDLGPDDAYYKKVDMDQVSMQSAINRNIDPEELNKTLNQMADYEQVSAQKAYQNKQLMAREKSLVKQMNLNNSDDLKTVVGAYDQSLGISLATAGVPTTKIKEVIPVMIAELYVNSQQQEEFPLVLERDAGGNPTKVASNSYQLMAHRAQQLKMGLTQNMPGFEKMLEAIRTGQYSAYRQQTMDSKRYNFTQKLAKDISKFYNK